MLRKPVLAPLDNKQFVSEVVRLVRERGVTFILYYPRGKGRLNASEILPMGVSPTDNLILEAF